MQNTLNILFLVNGIILLTGGIMIALISRNIIKMIIGFVIAQTGVNILIVASGYVIGGKAPVLSRYQQLAGTVSCDPIPQALVLTSIVIGIATTALFLFFALRFYSDKGTLNRDYTEDNDD
ncbi:MAG: sodium:proton antiporter [candidate division WOR-3 bacterium]|nr:sodium:proton antiporter [candidate division WOR-3 bacterium]